MALFFSSGIVHAYSIKQGTISVSGSSNIFFRYSNSDLSSATRTYSLSLQNGYFVKDNLEIGIQWSGYLSESDSTTSTSYAITPLITYHFSLGEKSNLFTGGGAGYSWSRYSYRFDNTHPGEIYIWRGARFEGLAGWEYLLTNEIFLLLKIEYDRWMWSSNSSDRNDRETDIISQLGVGFYF